MNHQENKEIEIHFFNHIAQCTNIIQNKDFRLQDVKITLENRDKWRKTENSMDRNNEIRVRKFVETIKEKLTKRKEEPADKRTLRGRKDLLLSVLPSPLRCC